MIYFCLDKILQIVLCFARLASCASASLCKPKEPYKGSLNTRKGAVVEEDPSTFSKFVYWKQDFEWKCGPFGHNFNFKRIHSEKLQKLLILFISDTNSDEEFWKCGVKCYFVCFFCIIKIKFCPQEIFRICYFL